MSKVNDANRKYNDANRRYNDANRKYTATMQKLRVRYPADFKNARSIAKHSLKEYRSSQAKSNSKALQSKKELKGNNLFESTDKTIKRIKENPYDSRYD